MTRRLAPELLDQLPADDPRARRARRDLRRLNVCMGNAGAMARALGRAVDRRAPRCILELGAGDGAFLLRVARRLAPAWQNVKVELLDWQRLLQAGTQAALARLGWQVEATQAEVFDWLQRPPGAPRDVLLANLFLHHFAEAQLTESYRPPPGGHRYLPPWNRAAPLCHWPAAAWSGSSAVAV